MLMQKCSKFIIHRILKMRQDWASVVLLTTISDDATSPLHYHSARVSWFPSRVMWSSISPGLLIPLWGRSEQISSEWCYQSQTCDDTCKDPSRWAALFPRCGGLRQSPINIVTNKVHFSSALPPFSFIGHTDLINITVENKGHSAHFALPQSVRLTGGGLPGHYRAAQFHFHWGGSGRPGSEHTIDGERFPMELHIVHIKEPYSSLEEAEHDMAGIALLAFLFEETTHDHPHLDTIIAALGQVPNTGNGTAIPNFRLSYVIPTAEELHSYYRYVGSMTTPGCEQAVAWTVFHRMLSISSKQLDAIVKQCRFLTGQPMTDIFRPTQPLDGRVVFSSTSGSAQRSVIHMWFSVFPALFLPMTLIHII